MEHAKRTSIDQTRDCTATGIREWSCQQREQIARKLLNLK